MNGLFFKHPTAAVLMLIFLLSLAGIPPTAGFIAKYYLFAGPIETDHNVLAVIAVLNAAISIYFYLRIVVAMFMKESNEKTGLALSPGIVVALAVALIFTLWIGFYPDPFIHLAREAVFWLSCQDEGESASVRIRRGLDPSQCNGGPVM